MPPVAATPTQPRRWKLLLKKKPSVSFLPLSESDRAQEGQIEACSFEWTNTTQKSRVMVESRKHATMQTIDYRLEPDSACCRQSITGSNSRGQKKQEIFDPIPTILKQKLNSMQNSNPKITKFTNNNKTVSETAMQTVLEKSPLSSTAIKQDSNSNKTVFEQY